MHCFCKKIRSHHCKVVLLDEQELIKEIQDNTRGQEILDIVFSHLNLIETAYFGLRYLDSSNQTHWLDPAKKIVKQLKGTDPFSLYFGVKFYAADPCKLLEEITRYQFFLQVKQDILQGRLPISFDVAAELGAYVVQSELGDYDPRRHSMGYVSEFRFISNQTVELESRIEELHKGLIGHLPAAAELSYLDKVKWLEMYGVDLHPVLGEDNVEYFLGLTPSGIIVLRNKNKVGHYYWPRISKIYFKGRFFMVRICDKNNEENTYGFETPSKPACKHLWKCCVEHHAFFRLVQVSPTAPDIFALGSRFRYSGRTEKQAQADAQMRLRSPPNFARTPSRRYQRRLVEGAPDNYKVEESINRENIPPHEHKMVSIPQPVTTVSSLYRSTCSIPAALPSQHRSESPRSTRSAPWTQPGHGRGLYNSATSPRSVRSAGNTTQLLHKLTQRSSSVDSQSSNDSRSCKRHRRHRSRKGSDNESELSKCSSRSHHRHRRRSHGKRDSESEKDHHHHRHRHKSGSSSRRRHGSHYELVDSEAQWKEVQRRQAEGGTGVHQATVINNKDRRSGYMNSGMETESEMSYHHKRKQKKHRSRSRSPSDGGKGRLPNELKKHLEFNLIDTDGMSESQLREIPYTVVETSTISKTHRKHSPNSKRKHNTNRKSRSSSKDDSCKTTIMESPPPPYTPSRDDNQSNDLNQNNKNPVVHISSGDSGHFSNTGPGSNSSSTSNSALGEFLNKNPPPSTHGGSGSSTHSPSGSVSTRNSNQMLPRSTNRSLSEYRSPSLQNITSSHHLNSSLVSSPQRKHYPTNKSLGAQTSALYGNPTTLLGNLNDNNQILRMSNSNINKTLTPSIKNEADDSGLSFDSQDYVYSKRTYQVNQNVKKTTNDNSSLPPLPYVQFGKPRSSHDRRSDRVRQHDTKSLENGTSNWNGTTDNNNPSTGNDKRRRGPLYYQQQPSPRVLRNSNNLNANGCSIIDWYSDHSCIEEDEEPNDNESEAKEEDSANLLNGNISRSGLVHEMSTEL